MVDYREGYWGAPGDKFCGAKLHRAHEIPIRPLYLRNIYSTAEHGKVYSYAGVHNKPLLLCMYLYTGVMYPCLYIPYVVKVVYVHK